MALVTVKFAEELGNELFNVESTNHKKIPVTISICNSDDLALDILQAFVPQRVNKQQRNFYMFTYTRRC
jgi:hypothetical protein